MARRVGSYGFRSVGRLVAGERAIRRRAGQVVLTALVGLGVSACDPPAPPPVTVPVDNSVVLRFHSRVPDAVVWSSLLEVPALTVYADGRVVRATRPQGRMPLYSVVQLDAAGLDAVMAQAAAAGFSTSSSYLGPRECDAAVAITTVSYSWNGVAAQTRVADFGGSNVGVSCPVSSAEAEVRARQVAFRTWMNSVEGALQPNVIRPLRPYASSGVAVMWFGRTATSNLDVQQWPATLAAPAQNPSIELRGSLCEVRTSFVEVLGTWIVGLRNTPDTVWLTPVGPYRVLIRPLLGDETGCASLA